MSRHQCADFTYRNDSSCSVAQAEESRASRIFRDSHKLLMQRWSPNLCWWSNPWTLNSAPGRGRRGGCRLLKWNGSTLNLLFPPPVGLMVLERREVLLGGMMGLASEAIELLRAALDREVQVWQLTPVVKEIINNKNNLKKSSCTPRTPGKVSVFF